MLDRLIEQARREGVELTAAGPSGQHAGASRSGSAGSATPVDLPLATDYVNTIAVADSPAYPGDLEIEQRITNAVRWNAAVMVSRANRPDIGVGGHIATFAGAATLYEVGHQHFFRGPDAPGGGDQIFFQGHASPGMYARAFVEGRLDETRMDGFRQELTNSAGGLPSYPHPRLMPDFWQFPTVSMGLGPDQLDLPGAVQPLPARPRLRRHLGPAGVGVPRRRGDGRGSSPSVRSGWPRREQLDNLTWVINCNLQRLDGPVRGNGKVMQELESHFRAPAGGSSRSSGVRTGTRCWPRRRTTRSCAS